MKNIIMGRIAPSHLEMMELRYATACKSSLIMHPHLVFNSSTQAHQKPNNLRFFWECSFRKSTESTSTNNYPNTVLPPHAHARPPSESLLRCLPARCPLGFLSFGLAQGTGRDPTSDLGAVLVW